VQRPAHIFLRVLGALGFERLGAAVGEGAPLLAAVAATHIPAIAPHLDVFDQIPGGAPGAGQYHGSLKSVLPNLSTRHGSPIFASMSRKPPPAKVE
jgi:hypothetical protein